MPDLLDLRERLALARDRVVAVLRTLDCPTDVALLDDTLRTATTRAAWLASHPKAQLTHRRVRPALFALLLLGNVEQALAEDSTLARVVQTEKAIALGTLLAHLGISLDFDRKQAARAKHRHQPDVDERELRAAVFAALDDDPTLSNLKLAQQLEDRFGRDATKNPTTEKRIDALRKRIARIRLEK